MSNFFITYDKNGKWLGFYDDIESIPEGYFHNPITNEMHNYAINLGGIKLDISKISSDTVVDSKDYFLDNTKVISIDTIKRSMIDGIKSKCADYIIHGLIIEISTGAEEFSYKLEDQINLKELIDHNKSGDEVLYHSKSNDFKLYKYDDIRKVYVELYNNKQYHLIYTNLVAKYINEKYTEEDYNNNVIIRYGFSNDDILKELEVLYEHQVLQ